MNENKLVAITMGDREKWLRAWCKGHRYNFESNTQRNTFIYYYFLTVQAAYGKIYAEEYTNNINSCFTIPIPVTELKRKMQTFSSPEHRNKRFKNETIISNLGITEKEVADLGIGHNLAYQTERQARKSEREDRNEKIIVFYNFGMIETEIACELGVSESTVKRTLAEIKRQTKNKRDQKIRDEHFKGKSISEIARICGCTRDTVRKVINDEKNSTLTITGEPKFENTLTKEQSATAKRLYHLYKAEKDVAPIDEKRLALRQLTDTTDNIWIQGSAGTGKTTLIAEFLQTLTSEQQKRTLVVASTGLVANAVGGTTIHKAFELKNCVQFPQKIDKIPKALKNIENIIIDEISTVRADVFTAMMTILQYVEVKLKRKIRIIVVGDFGQISPVLTIKDAEIFKTLYPESVDCYPYNSPMWNKAHFTKIVLHHVHRQTDPDYIHHLNGVKYGNFTDALWFVKHQSRRKIENPIYICARKSTVNEYNNKALSKFATSGLKEYKATIVGEADCELPCEKVITLAQGARIMTLINTLQYSNGSVGTVIKLYRSSIKVKLDSGETVIVKAKTFTLEDGSTFIQLPVMLAFAITVHKSQGCSFDAVTIVLDGFFQAGMLYVAISRCRSRSGLKFIGNLKQSDLIIDIEALKRTLT